MGIFQDTVEIINRTSKPLTLTFDGQRITLQPNYDSEGKLLKNVRNMIPRVCVPYAKNQNVLMGSEDPIDPSGFQSLVGVKTLDPKKQKDEISFLEQSTEVTRVPLAEYLNDPSLKVIPGRGVFRASEAVVMAPQGGGIANQSID